MMSRRKRASTNSALQEIELNLECDDEELSPAQKAHYNLHETQYNEVTAKLEAMVSSCGAEVIEKASEQVYVLQMNSASPAPPLAALSNASSTTSTKTSIVRQQNTPIATPRVQSLTAKPSSVILQTTPTQSNSLVGRTNVSSAHQTGGTYQLMMDPRLGLIVGQVQSQPNQPSVPVLQKTSAPPTKGTNVLKTQMAPVGRVATRVTPARNLTKGTSPTNVPVQTLPGKSTVVATIPPVTKRVGRSQNSIPQAPMPTENNSVGGLFAGGTKQWKPTVAPLVDLTADDQTRTGGNVPDSKEVMFNKLAGKTFPSLVVVARPYLRQKDLLPATINQGRTALDAKVKSVLMYTPTKFTEYLIQQGYVRSEQFCSCRTDLKPTKLHLGMYSDVSQFPYSGGYVWISECCSHRFVSVFSGSIFEGAPHPPTVLLKLIYHWSCQTNVANVAQWVKVDNFYVKNFFNNMRGICTSAVHEKYEKMGGARKRVEVGVISLGTTSQDGNMRQVKVEVLGVMEPESKLVRLRAVEPLQDGEKNYKRRFVKILEPLEQWVHKDSIILTDFTVDKGTLHQMGYNSVYQVSPATDSTTTSASPRYSNSNVMEYLRRIVPRMFQNTLSLLSRQIIQQFLDELVWRERWGPIPSLCFDNILLHLSEQTKLESHENLLTRLSRIQTNPFKDWSYKSVTAQAVASRSAANGLTVNQDNTYQMEPVRTGIDLLPASISSIDVTPSTSKIVAPVKRGRKRHNADVIVAAPPVKKLVLSDEQTSLESYYYGTMEGDPNIIKKEAKSAIPIKCPICPKKITNNITMLLHLIIHAEVENIDIGNITEKSLCKYCLNSFPNKPTLKLHIDEVHIKVDSRMIICRICNEKTKDRTSLIAHMHNSHVAMEMPYECGICTYRSSIHRDVVDHFYESHEGGESLQCPLCLKVVQMVSGGKVMESNLTFFLSHLQKHLRNTITRKCGKCNLCFVHRGIHKDHQDKDHASFKGQPGVRMVVQTNGTDCIMPIPNKTKPLYIILDKFDPKLKIGSGDTCNECGKSLQESEHFIGILKCSKCRFTTSCEKAMTEHSYTFHKKSTNTKKTDIKTLSHEMHCVCGFKSFNGNQLAKHMALCERKTAHRTSTSARLSTKNINSMSASFPPLVELDEDDEDVTSSDSVNNRWLKAFAPNRKEEVETEGKRNIGPPSMLNMLGLVRKPSTEDLTNVVAEDDKNTETGDKKGEVTPMEIDATESPTLTDAKQVDTRAEVNKISSAYNQPKNEKL